MRPDYIDGMTLTSVSRSVAKETVSIHAQRSQCNTPVDELQWEHWVAVAIQEGTALFHSL